RPLLVRRGQDGGERLDKLGGDAVVDRTEPVPAAGARPARAGCGLPVAAGLRATRKGARTHGPEPVPVSAVRVT
ncbi:hypothetical protein ABZ016_22950, partial [Streptomyces sp. NPDC006372]